jgi:hypothetical protein
MSYIASAKELKNIFKDNEPLRSYLFMVSIDNKEDANVTTACIRDIKWERNEIIVDTLVPENQEVLSQLLSAKKLIVTFLARDGYRKFTQEFTLKNLKQYHPLRIGHADIEMLIYRFYFEY